jgi:phage terminase large subunit-like protein
LIAQSRRFNVASMGRRWGKSTLGIDRVVRPALEGRPVAWFAPSHKNLAETWRELRAVLQPVTRRHDGQEHRIELMTGGVLEMWSLHEPVVIRGRKYARVVIDEAAQIPLLQDAWEQVIRPTLADYVGDAWFMSTPRGFNYFKTLFDRGQAASFPQWASWQMPTHTNPHIGRSELEDLQQDLPARVYRQEILALFEEDQAGALVKREWIDAARLYELPELVRVVVGVDPTNTATGDEAGIIVAGVDERGHGYVFDDKSLHGSPTQWGGAAVAAYHVHQGDLIAAEVNNGGEMVLHVLQTVPGGQRVPAKALHASRGKRTRAEPIAALYERGMVHHVGALPALEDEWCSWCPGMDSPNRLDACTWALTELLLGPHTEALDVDTADALLAFSGR